METHSLEVQLPEGSGSAPALARGKWAPLKGGCCKTIPDSVPCWKGDAEL